MFIVQFKRNTYPFMRCFKFTDLEAAERFHAWVKELSGIESSYCGQD